MVGDPITSKYKKISKNINYIGIKISLIYVKLIMMEDLYLFQHVLIMVYQKI